MIQAKDRNLPVRSHLHRRQQKHQEGAMLTDIKIIRTHSFIKATPV